MVPPVKYSKILNCKISSVRKIKDIFSGSWFLLKKYKRKILLKAPSKTIILAVMPARTDIEADIALDLIKEYDAKGERTVGVLTKLDLMNEGTFVVGLNIKDGFWYLLSFQLLTGSFVLPFNSIENPTPF